jgi:nicotinamide riboside kinase
VELPYDLYLLCYPDLKWQPDPLRENPENREYLFGQFVKELDLHNFNYRIVKGRGDERLKNAFTFVDNLDPE